MYQTKRFLKVLVPKYYKSTDALIEDAFRALLNLKPELKVEMAIELYLREEISLTRASEIVGMDIESFKDMLKDIKEGLIVEHLMGATQGNILGGEFSGNVLLGYKVERGEIVGRVKDTMVSGNIYEILSDITAIGNEPRWIGASLKTPALYFSNLAVASKNY